MLDYQYPGDDGLPDVPHGWWTRWRLRAPWWPFVLIAFLFGSYYFWRYRTPTVAMVGLTQLEDTCFAALFFGLLAVLRGFQVLVRYSTEIAYSVPHKFYHLRHWCLPWLFVLAVGIYVGIGYEGPMRVSFWLSRPALNHLADEALADPDQAYLLVGRRAGLYRIAGVEVIGSTVVLYLDEDQGTYGFVRAPGTTADRIQNCSSGGYAACQAYSDFPKMSKHLDDPVGKRISEDWFVMYSRYWLVKVGPS